MLNTYTDALLAGNSTPLLLVVDDDMVIRGMLQRLLSEQGYNTIEAENGAEALAAFQRHQPDMVLMDAAMPVLDGFAACEEMKKLPQGQHTPVLMITALHDEESVDQAFAAGAVEYITKPIHWAVLRHRVDTLLKAQRAERALIASEARFRGVYEQAAMGIALVDMVGQVQHSNPALERMLGQPAETLRGMAFGQLFQAAGSRHIEAEFVQQLLDNSRACYQMEKAIAGPLSASPPPWARLTTSLVRGADQQPQFLIHMIEDISLQKQARIAQRIASRVFENTTDGVVITDAQGHIRDANVPFLLACGYSYEEILDRKPNLLRSDRHDPAFYQKMWADLQDSGHWSGEIHNRRKDGGEYSQWLSISAVHGEANEIIQYVGVYSAAPTGPESALPSQYYVIHYDPLTSLPNRLLFHERLTRACRQGENVALMYLDLDCFEAFNNRHGHAQGDEVLKAIARRLRKVARDNDIVARLEGDEFAVVLTQFSQPYDVRLVADRILAELARPFALDGQTAQIDCNLGISLYPGAMRQSADNTRGAPNVETLIQYADLALYRAKSTGKNTYRIFCESELEE